MRPGTVPRCDARPRTTRRALPVVAVAHPKGREGNEERKRPHAAPTPMRVSRSSVELVSDVVGSSSRAHASRVRQLAGEKKSSRSTFFRNETVIPAVLSPDNGNNGNNMWEYWFVFPCCFCRHACGSALGRRATTLS